MNKTSTTQTLLYSIPLAGVILLLGAGLSALSPRPGQTTLYTVKMEPNFWIGWLGFSLLLALGSGLMWFTWRWAGAGRRLAVITLVALVVRLGVSVFLYVGLPLASPADAEKRGGYLFNDAYARDTRAWDLVRFNQPVLSAFTDDFVADQYGGMASVSALLYKALSPDAHRPLLVIVLAVLAGTLAVPIAWRGVRERWGEPVAAGAAWILGLYPESVLLSSAQMREPFLITLSALAFWAVLSWKERRAGVWLALAGSLLGLVLFSSRITVIIMGVLAVFWWLEAVPTIRSPWLRWAGWTALALGGVGAALLSRDWLQTTAAWDALQTFKRSGYIQTLLWRFGDGWEVLLVPFITVYGLATPVLPAALTDPAVWIRQAISIYRAIGWYSLAPLLVYSLFTIWRVKDRQERRVLLWLALAGLAWVCISSYRAGGDIWDNPRYRTILLVWLALLAAWGWNWARVHKDAWLGRWLAVEGIFLACFTVWYANRKFGLHLPIPFWGMVGFILALSALVLVGGWWLDRRKRKQAEAAQSLAEQPLTTPTSK